MENLMINLEFFFNQKKNQLLFYGLNKKAIFENGKIILIDTKWKNTIQKSVTFLSHGKIWCRSEDLSFCLRKNKDHFVFDQIFLKDKITKQKLFSFKRDPIQENFLFIDINTPLQYSKMSICNDSIHINLYSKKENRLFSFFYEKGKTNIDNRKKREKVLSSIYDMETLCPTITAIIEEDVPFYLCLYDDCKKKEVVGENNKILVMKKRKEN